MKICAPDAETRRKSALAKAWINFHCQNFFCLFYPLKAWTRGKISLAAQVSQWSYKYTYAYELFIVSSVQCN